MKNEELICDNLLKNEISNGNSQLLINNEKLIDQKYLEFLNKKETDALQKNKLKFEKVNFTKMMCNINDLYNKSNEMIKLKIKKKKKSKKNSKTLKNNEKKK